MQTDRQTRHAKIVSRISVMNPPSSGGSFLVRRNFLQRILGNLLIGVSIDYQPKITGSFTPLVMSLTGGAGPAATTCFKRLASLLSKNSSTLAWLRCTLSFALLRSSIRCLQGARSAAGRPSRNVLLPVDLVLTEAGFEI